MQSVVARLHRKILQGLCREGVLITAIMTTRFPRNAKRQNGTLMALKMMTCTKEAVSLLGIGTQRGRPQMELFSPSAIAVSQIAKKKSEVE